MTRIAFFAALTAALLLASGAYLGVSSVSNPPQVQQASVSEG